MLDAKLIKELQQSVEAIGGLMEGLAGKVSPQKFDMAKSIAEEFVNQILQKKATPFNNKTESDAPSGEDGVRKTETHYPSQDEIADAKVEQSDSAEREASVVVIERPIGVSNRFEITRDRHWNRQGFFTNQETTLALLAVDDRVLVKLLNGKSITNY